MLIKTAEKKVNEIAEKSDIYIKGIWLVDCMFNPNPQERVFDFKFIVVKSSGQGSAYSVNKNYKSKDLKKYMGKKVNEIQIDDVALKVAIYDSVFGNFQKKDYKELILQGDSVKKSIQRAKIVKDEVLHLAEKGCKVLNVGVVSNIIKELIDAGLEVCATDYDNDIIGTELMKDVFVYHGNKTLELIKKSDVAVVTGMTISTNTVDEIINVAKENDTKLVFFAETASNMGDIFIDAGADSFISEPFPFYIYDGITKIRIKRRNEEYDEKNCIFKPRMQDESVRNRSNERKVARCGVCNK